MKVINGWDYFFMFVAGVFGIIIHVLIKIRGIRKRLRQNLKPGEEEPDPKEVFKIYFRKDWDSLMLSFMAVLACMFIINEFIYTKEFDHADTVKELGWKYKMANFIKTLFIVIGYSAQSLIYATLGRAERVLIKKASDGGLNVAHLEEEN